MDRAIAYLREHTEVRDVILSGGGFIELAVVNGSAAQELGVKVGNVVEVTRK